MHWFLLKTALCVCVAIPIAKRLKARIFLTHLKNFVNNFKKEAQSTPLKLFELTVKLKIF
jgi:hypothetical protein